MHTCVRSTSLFSSQVLSIFLLDCMLVCIPSQGAFSLSAALQPFAGCAGAFSALSWEADDFDGITSTDIASAASLRALPKIPGGRSRLAYWRPSSRILRTSGAMQFRCLLLRRSQVFSPFLSPRPYSYSYLVVHFGQLTVLRDARPLRSRETQGLDVENLRGAAAMRKYPHHTSLSQTLATASVPGAVSPLKGDTDSLSVLLETDAGGPALAAPSLVCLCLPAA